MATTYWHSNWGSRVPKIPLSSRLVYVDPIQVKFFSVYGQWFLYSNHKIKRYSNHDSQHKHSTANIIDTEMSFAARILHLQLSFMHSSAQQIWKPVTTTMLQFIRCRSCALTQRVNFWNNNIVYIQIMRKIAFYSCFASSIHGHKKSHKLT